MIPVVLKFTEPSKYAGLANYGYEFKGNTIQLASVTQLCQLMECMHELNDARFKAGDSYEDPFTFTEEFMEFPLKDGAFMVLTL